MRFTCIAAFAAALFVPTAAAAAVPVFDHVAIIMLENHSNGSIIGNPAAPQMTALAHAYAYAGRYYGVTHPSLPNYIAITSGNNWYSNSDDEAQRFNHVNIVDELEAAGISWKAYMQSMPSVGYTGSSYPTKDPLYVLRHNPFMLYDDVRSNPARRTHDVPLAQLNADLRSGKLAQFIWISPNVCHDMHGMSGGECPYSRDAALRSDGDTFVGTWVKKIMASPGWTKNSVIFVMTDETDYNGDPKTGGWLSAKGCCDSPIVVKGASFFSRGGVYGGGPSPLVVIGGNVKRGYVSHEPMNHYSVLRTIEEAWHLPLLGMAGDTLNVPSLASFFAP